MLEDSARIDGSSIANSTGGRMNFELSPANLLHPLQILPPSFSTIVIVARREFSRRTLCRPPFNENICKGS